MFAPTQCSKKITGCFCDSIYVKNTVYTDLIQPKTAGGTVSIPSLVVPPPVIECLTLSASQTIVGCDASNGGGANNTSVGIRAGQDLTTGGNNTILGYEAGKSLTTGPQNVIIGQNAGEDLTTAQDNVLVGSGAGKNATNFINSAMFGNFSGFNTTGNNNTFIGHRAGFFHTTGSNNVIIGTNSGSDVLSTDTGCVLIGTNVGGSTVGDNRLMIDNSNTNEPLIDGDFSGDTLQVNGTVTLGQSLNTVNEHRINGRLANDGNNIVDYLVVWINNVERRIPIYDISP